MKLSRRIRLLAAGLPMCVGLGARSDNAFAVMPIEAVENARSPALKSDGVVVAMGGRTLTRHRGCPPFDRSAI